MLKGNILITGGSGSLGTAILDRATRENWDAKFTIIARNESKMNVVRQRFPRVKCEIGDVRDFDHMRTLFQGQDLIIHAAAIKIVPVAEANPREAILTNVMGSMNVAQAAVQAGVSQVVGISTDKACGPTYYGTTKRLMEGIWREARNWGKTKFRLCRYGNVLKSNNSVVPFFEKQIADNKPFTITDFRMTRFWLSMKQAVDLIIYTATRWEENGIIIVPEAPMMSIVNLAKTLDPNRQQIEIGIRPGERLHEILIMPEEAMHTLKTDNHFFVFPPETELGRYRIFEPTFSYTSETARQLTVEEMKKLLEDS